MLIFMGAPAIAATAFAVTPLARKPMPGPLPSPKSMLSDASPCWSRASPANPVTSSSSPRLLKLPISTPTSMGVNVQAKGTALPRRTFSAASALATSASATTEMSVAKLARMRWFIVAPWSVGRSPHERSDMRGPLPDFASLIRATDSCGLQTTLIQLHPEFADDRSCVGRGLLDQLLKCLRVRECCDRSGFFDHGSIVLRFDDRFDARAQEGDDRLRRAGPRAYAEPGGGHERDATLVERGHFRHGRKPLAAGDRENLNLPALVDRQHR